MFFCEMFDNVRGDIADSKGMKSFSGRGELSVVGKSGYLPAEDKPKMAFFGVLVASYVGLCGIWAYLCWKWRDVTLSIHNFIGICILCGLAEVRLALFCSSIEAGLYGNKKKSRQKRICKRVISRSYAKILFREQSRC